MNEATHRILPSTCWECSAYCGSLVSLGADGRVLKVAPNPASPVSAGAFCVKGIRALPEATYQDARLTHPLRRIGPRGSGQWERVSWDSALDEMADRFAETRARYGAPSLVGAVSGAAFSRGAVMALLMRSLGSPNWMINQDLCGGCRGVSDKVTGLAITGGEDIPNAACVLLVGRNPAAADPPQWIELKRAKARGARVVVIDPFRTQAAELADLWLRPEPGTDAAIALAMIRHLVVEGAWDRDFVARHTHGFAALAERAARYTPEVAAAITGVPAADIRRAAEYYAAGPACFVSGHGIDAASNGVQTFRAFHALVAISGNLDRPGGNRRSKRPPGFRTWMDLLHDPRFRLPEAVERRTIGADRFPLWAGPGGWQTACHNSSVLEAMLTGTPYPVRAMVASGVNIAVMYPDTRRTLRALASLDFLCVAAQTMTPTAAVADLVLPKTTGLEEEEVALSPKGPCITYTAAVAPPVGEARCDLTIAVGLLDRMRARGAVTAELLPWRDKAAFNAFLIGDSGVSLEALRRDGFAQFDYTMGDFDRQVFATPTGKVELHSVLLERAGQDPLPDYVPPLDRAAPAPGFPLRLQTGIREKTYHHSRFREQAWARKVSPDPRVHVHPETAADYGIGEGDWVRVETPGGAGPVRLKAAITDRTRPGVLTTGVGWWRPEAPGPEFGALDVNVNAALSYTGPTDPVSGSVDTGAIPCRVCRVPA
ncbi:molybdopterin-dependent oxidoreductase [Paeniroseomonas aquatica]|uniref:Molybdopterin-dependent oxidoreductase n=2 Tax=Paeniroseomonas aquatica TaxID=373043 RepID=A0ABT8AAX4_9PROT|nr:molybdopterin-dependent oxidoreductase [Paeniroseomonas aquatica]MDN3566860.1 molybdopterin-dependent oxidoreductase [Paeniroseomonas aquatica]